MEPHDLEQRWHSRGYQRLSGNSIRLLSIKPGFPTEPVECAFITVKDLDEAPAYHALSYVWGTELSLEPIACNGIDMPVTKNLSDALKHLRLFPGWDSVAQWTKDHPLHSGRNAWGGFAKNRNEHRQDNTSAKDVLLWVDAICINQEDYDERSHQVKMMGMIYARASAVMIWLGKEDTTPLVPTNSLPKDREALFQRFYLGLYGMIPVCLSFIAQALKNADGGRNRLAETRPVEDLAHRNMAYGFPHPSAMEWDALREFFTNPWFQRVWVVQEAVLADRATALIGDWEIDWGAMGRAAVWFQSKGYAMPTVLKYQMRDRQSFLPISQVTSAWILCSWPEQKIPLLHLLRNFRSRLATNPVDKVYGTFGLAEELKSVEKDGFHMLIEPSYTKDVVDVYRDIAKFLIIEHGDLQILSHAGGSTTTSNWPSWVPDWRHEKASNELSISQSPNLYNADRDQTLAIGISKTPSSLALQGIEIDVIRAYCDRLTSYGVGFVTYQEEIDFVERAWTLFVRRSSHLPDPYANEDISSHFIHTLTAGRSNTCKPIFADPGFLVDALHWFTQHAPNLIPTVPITQRIKWSLLSSPDSGRFHEAFVQTCMDRRFFVSRSGLMGIGPDTMKEGDLIVVLFGGKVPYVIRPVDGGYKFLGECYVPGLMDGEAVVKWESEGKKETFFELL
jgi:hypothetical protein